MILDRALAAPGDENHLLDPASRASSTAYWISGRSTTGSISLGIALVAGRKRVPRPATGKTALRIGFMDEGLAPATSGEKRPFAKIGPSRPDIGHLGGQAAVAPYFAMPAYEMPTIRRPVPLLPL